MPPFRQSPLSLPSHALSSLRLQSQMAKGSHSMILFQNKTKAHPSTLECRDVTQQSSLYTVQLGKLRHFWAYPEFCERRKVGGVWKWYQSPLSTNLSSLLLLSFPITFFLPSALPWHPLWHERCITNLDDDSKGKPPFQHPATSLLHCYH
jgi:hypothetical protein